MIPLYCLHTASHETLYEDWFCPSLPDEYDVRATRCDATPGGHYRDPDWSAAVRAKSDMIVRAIEENPGLPFVYSDVDIQFFGPTRALLLQSLGDHDIVCQKDDHLGRLCTGFFVARGSDRLRALWQRVRQCAADEGRDQRAFNVLVREDRSIGADALPPEFFGAGCGLPAETRREDTGLPPPWTPGTELTIPENIVMHHANWTVGVDNKIDQLRYVASLQARSTTGRA